MNATSHKRIGGRGCPKCGSHDTEGVAKGGAQWCNSCGHRWAPCSAHCRGYDLEPKHNDGPRITGCRNCGVPDFIARHWPEAWRAMALKLAGSKLDAVR